MLKRLLLLAVVALAATAALADDPHPFSVHDMLAMDRLGDPQVSPDGKWVAYTVSTPDVEANRSRSDIWLTSVDGATTKRLKISFDER